MSEKLPLTLAVITLDEEDNIERCLRSVPFASQVVVVDGGSQDRTTEIAKQLGAEVYVESWKGFEKQKQSATDRARFPWVLSLDADEELSSDLRQEITELFHSKKIENGCAAYELPRLSRYLGRWIRHGGWYPDYQRRLFHREKCRWAGGDLHEFIQAPSSQKLNSPIHHYVFRSISHHVETNNRYSSLGATQLAQRENRFSVLKLLIKPSSKFFETYLLKRGFMDGLAGFIISVGASYSVFLKWAKLWEKHNLDVSK